MCRWLAYSGSPILMNEALYGGENSLVDQSLHSRLGAEPTNGDGFGVGWYGEPPTPGVFHSIEPAWNDAEPARARRPHQLTAVLHAYPGGDRQRRAADQLSPVPPRPLAVHAQRLHQRVRHDQARPRTRRRPVALPRDQRPGRHRGPVLPRAHPRPRGRPAGRGRRRRSGSSKRLPSATGSRTRSRARSRPPTARASGRSATRASESRARCSTRPTFRGYASYIPR